MIHGAHQTPENPFGLGFSHAEEPGNSGWAREWFDAQAVHPRAY